MALYCDQTDLNALGFTVAVQDSNGILSSQLSTAIEHQSDVVEGYLSSRYQPPFSSWGKDVRLACATLVIWELLSPKIGPEDPQFTFWLQRSNRATQWLTDVAKGVSRPVGLVSVGATSSDATDPGPAFTVVSNTQGVWPW